MAALWASEGSIYGRFGYGLATLSCDIAAPRERLTIPATGSSVETRLVTVEDGLAAIPPIYLGGFTFAQLAAARRVEQLSPGAIERADALFWTDRAPWCPEVF